jgi:Mg2+ and Co2+ transporter CorA
MKMNWFILASGKLERQQVPFNWSTAAQVPTVEVWLDIEQSEAINLPEFLAPLELHPLQLAHCLDTAIYPGVLAFGNTLLMEYPAAFSPTLSEPAYLSLILHGATLVTVRHGPMPALDELIAGLTGTAAPDLHHLPELIYQILDQFADQNVDAQIAVRDQIQQMAKTMAEAPNAVTAQDLTGLRWQVGNLISLIENQLYCVTRLAASDIQALSEPHRKAYVDDLVSEAEVAQRGVYRLETRVNDLYHDYQMLGSDRVEKRLRLLTIISAITLPLGLIAGLLGMNVGGVPATGIPYAFMIVVALMLVIVFVQYWYFRSRGWFD